jgi:hypothetical protein
MPIVPEVDPALAPAVTADGPPPAPDAVEAAPDLGTVVEYVRVPGKHGVPRIERRRRKRRPDEVAV